MRCIMALFAIVNLTACSIYTKLDAIPQGDDFHLPPKALLANYPDIEKYYVGRALSSGKPVLLGDSLDEWGTPQVVDVEDNSNLIFRSFVVAELGTFLADIPLVWAAAGAFFLSRSSPSIHVYTWEQGDYQINADVARLEDKTVLRNWQWSRREADNYVPLPIKPESHNNFMLFGFSAGSAWPGASLDRDEPNMEHGLSIGVGREFDLGEKFIADASVAYAMHNNNGDSSNGYFHIDTLPVAASLLYKSSTNWWLGGGIAYHMVKSVSTNTSSGNGYSDTTSSMLKLEYRNPNFPSILGVQLEFFDLQSDSNPTYDGNNICFYSKARF